MGKRNKASTELIYDAGRVLWQARVVAALLLFLAGMLLTSAWVERYSDPTFALFALVTALLILCAGEAYVQVVPVRIERSGDEFLLHTLGWVQARREVVKASDLLAIEELESPHSLGYTPSMEYVRIAGRWLPVVLDSRAAYARLQPVYVAISRSENTKRPQS